MTRSTPLAIPGHKSHSLAFSVLRTKPRRWAHHIYCDGGIQIMGNQCHDLVLEPLALVVRERQVVRIGAHPQLARSGRQRSKKQDGGQDRGFSLGGPRYLAAGAGGGRQGPAVVLGRSDRRSPVSGPTASEQKRRAPRSAHQGSCRPNTACRSAGLARSRHRSGRAGRHSAIDRPSVPARCRRRH